VVYAQPWPRRLRAVFAGETVLDTNSAIALHETGRLIEHWIPLADIRDDLLEPTGSESPTRWKVKGRRSDRGGRGPRL